MNLQGGRANSVSYKDLLRFYRTEYFLNDFAVSEYDFNIALFPKLTESFYRLINGYKTNVRFRTLSAWLDKFCIASNCNVETFTYLPQGLTASFVFENGIKLYVGYFRTNEHLITLKYYKQNEVQGT